MGSQTRILTGGLLAVLLLANGCSTTTPIRVSGLVQSSKTDENDNPVSIYIWDGKTGLPIEDNKAMQELLEKVDSKVEADADLTETYSGQKSILIKKYKVLREAGE